MTYTLLARCPKTGALGVSIATYSLAVGSKCPAIASNVGAITTQAFVNPTLKALGLRLLGLGHPAAQVLELLRGADSDFEFRQVALVDRNGQVACHTGSRTRPWAGHQIGDGFAALGNVLKGEAVACGHGRGVPRQRFGRSRRAPHGRNRGRTQRRWPARARRPIAGALCAPARA